MIGRDISHYRVLEKVGEGGMGVVYKAEDVRLKRTVALKFLSPQLTEDETAIGRFERESQAAAALNHPNIVTIHDVGQYEGQTYFCMEYVEGEELSSVLESGQMPPERAVDISMQLCAALGRAHQAGIVHRDIKPANVMIDRSGAVKVLDFGLAKLRGVTKLTQDTSTVGTVGFMSPEQIKGEEVDHRTDIWSLGVLLYRMVAGDSPWPGDYDQAVAYTIVNEPHRPLGELCPGVPEHLQRIVDTALSKNREERYQTIELMLDDLSALAPSAGPRPTPGRLRRSNRMRLYLGAAVGVVILVLAVAYWRHLTSRDSERSAATATPPPPQSVRTELKQVTFSDGREEYPALSPDGDRIAFCAEPSRFKQVFVKDLESGVETQVTDTEADNIQPSWSPDGNTLLFVRSNASDGKLEPGDVFGVHTHGDVWMYETGSGREHKIINDAYNPTFSPDGTRIAFDASLAGPRRIWVADHLGRNPRQVTFDESEAVNQIVPGWSPDGTKIVFQNMEWTTFDIKVVDVESGEIQWVTHDRYLDLNPVWSPTGKAIYMSSYRSGGLNLWRVNVDLRGLPVAPPQQITTGAGQDVQLSITGAGLAFSIVRQNADLWRLPVSPQTGLPQGDPVPVIKTTREDSRGAWSPDGSNIAFNSDRNGDMNIWLHSLEDNSTRQVTFGPGGDFQANWSPDGLFLAFFSARDGNNDIWVANVESGDLKQLTSNLSMEINPFFSPDGERIAYQSDLDGRLEVWVTDADGTNHTRLTNIGVSGHFMRWSPDGDLVVFRSPSGQAGQLYVVPLDGGPPTPFAVIAGGAHISLSPDRTAIMDVSGHKVIWLSSLGGEDPVSVFEFEDPDIRIDYPVWSPDGNWLLFDHFEPQGGDIWVMTNFE